MDSTNTSLNSSVSTTEGQQPVPPQASPTTPHPSITTHNLERQQSVQAHDLPTTTHPAVTMLGHGATANVQPCTGPAYRDLKTWKDCVQDWYPDLLHRAHFMPHVYMNRVLHDIVQVSGVDVAVPQPLEETPHTKGGPPALLQSDVRDDTAQQHVLHCLRKIADGALPGNQPEVMFVLSQMNFGDYLNSPCYSSAATCLPRPVDLSGQGLDRGDFDVLVIHRQYGLMVGEIKAVGASAAERGLSDQQLEDELLAKLKKMLNVPGSFMKKLGRQKRLGQLSKAREVLRHVTKDQPSIPRVRTTLILPHITRGQLRKTLAKNTDVKEALGRDLGLRVTDDPVDFCLCSDQMPDFATPSVFPSNVLSELDAWWRGRMSGEGPDPAMSDDVYLDLVARFAGPASIVRVHCPSQPRLLVSRMRTEGQAVSETHDRLTRLALYPSQVDVLQQGGQLVYLTGPPGTGKTLMLVLEGMEWLRQNRHVHIASLWYKSRAASFHIYQQLKKTARKLLGLWAARRVHIHLLDECDHDGLEMLENASRDKELWVIADEVQSGHLTNLYHHLSASSKITNLHLWSAGLKCTGVPSVFHEISLTEPLRCPPSVVREVKEAVAIQQASVLCYSQPQSPTPCDGPPVIKLHHTDGSGGHKGRYTHECEQCGLDVGRVLQGLHVGKTTNSSRSPVIRHRDVIVLVVWGGPRSGSSLWEGRVIQSSSGVVAGLGHSGFPVRIIRLDDVDDIADMAAMRGRDEVIVTGVENVWGLERKVVVVLGDWDSLDSYDGRLYAMSRSTAQLITVVNHVDFSKSER